ncbi:hypothetical protein RHSIM_Rhsim03G0132400 [Rhododendron simsii]|uniref:Uncharacterized protein n=1 Tax=Rhododendron simsii TaxID=118357 RepID=A0A834H7W9_RHOSS|nr:hypothetical protein RHSIM_Rhsim03G0132400 [Rhododendron simsii]
MARLTNRERRKKTNRKALLAALCMMRVFNSIIQLYLLITELIAERNRQRLGQKPHLHANPNAYQSQLDALNRLVSIPMESKGTSQSEPTSRRKRQDHSLWTFEEEEALLAAMMESEDAAEVEEVVETPQDEANIDLDDMVNERYTPTFANGDTVNANTPTSNANAPTSNVVPGRLKKKAKVDANEASVYVAMENLLAQSNTTFNKIVNTVGYEDRLSAKREKVFTELMKLDLEMINRFMSCFVADSYLVYSFASSCFVAVLVLHAGQFCCCFNGKFGAILGNDDAIFVGQVFGQFFSWFLAALCSVLVPHSASLLDRFLANFFLFLGWSLAAFCSVSWQVGIAFSNYDGLNGNLVANGSATLIILKLSEPKCCFRASSSAVFCGVAATGWEPPATTHAAYHHPSATIRAAASKQANSNSSLQHKMAVAEQHPLIRTAAGAIDANLSEPLEYVPVTYHFKCTEDPPEDKITTCVSRSTSRFGMPYDCDDHQVRIDVSREALGACPFCHDPQIKADEK